MKNYNTYTYGMKSPQNWKQQSWKETIKETAQILLAFVSGLIITSGVITFFYTTLCFYSHKI